MKITLLFFILLSCFIGQTQTNAYHPYPSGWGASWTIHTQDWQGTANYPTMDWSEDTIINSQTYQKVLVNGVYIGGVRQNIPLEQAYFINSQNSEFNIGIDQNSLIGDTIYFAPETDEILSLGHGFIALDSLLIVTEIDSVLVLGNYRKQFTLQTLDPLGSSSFNEAHFVAGIGFTYFLVFEFGYSVACHLNENTLLIGNPINPLCALGTNDLDLLKFKIHPNPVTHEMHFEPPLENGYSIGLFTSNGQLISPSNYKINSNRINLSSLSKGIYIVVVSTTNGSVTKKIIKQ